MDSDLYTSNEILENKANDGLESILNVQINDDGNDSNVLLLLGNTMNRIYAINFIFFICKLFFTLSKI